MSINLYYFTDAYPYGKGEKSFVEPEIEKFSEYFETTIVSLASKKITKDKTSKSEIPKNVRLVECGETSLILRLAYMILFPFSKLFREEYSYLKKKRRKKFICFVESALAYSRAQVLRRTFEKKGIFAERESSIYYTFWFNSALLACSLENLKSPLKGIFSRIHGYDLYEHRARNNWQPLQCFKALSVDKIILLTEKAKCYFEETYCNLGRKAVICPLGCRRLYPIDDFMNKPKNKDKFLIVSCSNVIPLKRVNLIAEAIALLDDISIEWIHFGDGSMLSNIRNFAQRNNMDATFTGFISNKDVQKFYSGNQIDVFVTVSSSEGLPVSIQEAMAYGIPIIGTDVGGISEEIDGNGILLPRNPSKEEVANAIRKMYCLSDEKRKAMRGRSVELWNKKFDSLKNSERTLKVLVETISV